MTQTIQNVSKIGGHILDTWFMDQSNEKTLYKHVYYDTQENLTVGFATTTALDINTHVNNPRFILQYQWS